MFDVMKQAKNAINAYNTALSIHSANIANMSVNGYKSLDISFQTILAQAMNGGSAADLFANRGGINPMQTGGGAGISDVNIDFSAGEYITGQSIDLAISGNGLFIVSTDGGDSYRYTKAGEFSIDSSGSLVTAAGHQLYGLDSAGNLIAITGLPGAATNYRWNEGTGSLEYSADGTTYTATGYRIALTSFPNQNGLAQSDGTTFVETLASGSAATPSAPGGTVGGIKSGSIEKSNVFYLGETIDSLEIQRALNGNLSVIKMASDIIQNFITKLG